MAKTTRLKALLARGALGTMLALMPVQHGAKAQDTTNRTSWETRVEEADKAWSAFEEAYPNPAEREAQGKVAREAFNRLAEAIRARHAESGETAGAKHTEEMMAELAERMTGREAETGSRQEMQEALARALEEVARAQRQPETATPEPAKAEH